MASDNSGYIFLHRKIRDHQFWTERRKFSRMEAWIDIIMEVRWQKSEAKVLLGNQVISCGYGQSLNSLLTWASRWHWSEPSVRRFFNLLANESMIVRETVAKTTRITVCNFSRYQDVRRQNDGMATGWRRDGDAMVTTEEEGKELQERKEEEIMSSRKLDPIPYRSIIDHLNDQAGTSFKHTSQETKRLIKARWNQGFRVDDFKTVINVKCDQWKSDPKMLTYLRPTTLFGIKFESYLNENGRACACSDINPEDPWSFS